MNGWAGERIKELQWDTLSDKTMLDESDELSDEKLCSTKTLSKKACIFRLFYETKVMKILSDEKLCSVKIMVDSVVN